MTAREAIEYAVDSPTECRRQSTVDGEPDNEDNEDDLPSIAVCESTGKLAHPTFYSAAIHMRQLAKIERTVNQLAVYRCRACQSWHVGHDRRRR